jgi:hypothetical protein
MNTLIEWLNLLVVVLLAIWSVYQTRLTKNLEEKIHRLSIELDQSYSYCIAHVRQSLRFTMRMFGCSCMELLLLTSMRVLEQSFLSGRHMMPSYAA